MISELEESQLPLLLADLPHQRHCSSGLYLFLLSLVGESGSIRVIVQKWLFKVCWLCSYCSLLSPCIPYWCGVSHSGFVPQYGRSSQSSPWTFKMPPALTLLSLFFISWLLILLQPFSTEVQCSSMWSGKVTNASGENRLSVTTCYGEMKYNL